MSEEQNNEQKPLDVMAFLKADKAKFDAAVGNTAPAEPTVTQMTAEEFIKKFHEEIRDTADVQWREDKEGDYEHKGIPAWIGLEWTSNDHEEIEITDLRDAREEMVNDPDSPLVKAVWRKPRAPKPVAEKKPKKAKAEKKPKKAKAEKKPKKAKAPKVKLTPLDEMSYDDFEKLVEEHGEDGVFEMYADEIQDYGEWIWREQDRGGPTYDLQSCVRMAQEELMNGTWGPRAE